VCELDGTAGVKPTTRLPEEIERDVRVLLRYLRKHRHVEAYLTSTLGKLRVHTVGRDCERIGRYVVGIVWEDLGELIREDVAHAIELVSDRGRG